MKPQQRQQEMAEIIQSEGEVSVDALAARFAISTETIRRDLAKLAEGGRIQKVHGGARRPRLLAEGSFTQRLGQDGEAKAVIAAKLARAIKPGDTLFIDAGSTTLAAARSLAGIARLTVITNSLRVAGALGQLHSDAVVYLLGGQHQADNAETFGPMAISQIAGFLADHAVLTVAAVDPSIGVMDASFDEAQIARAMIANSRRVIALATAAKFGLRAAHLVCPSEHIGLLISDDGLAAAQADALRAQGVDVW